MPLSIDKETQSQKKFVNRYLSTGTGAKTKQCHLLSPHISELSSQQAGVINSRNSQVCFAICVQESLDLTCLSSQRPKALCFADRPPLF